MARTEISRVKFSAVLFVFAALLIPSLAGAAEHKNDGGWDFRLTAYLWGANLTANLPGQDNSAVPFYKLLDDLHMGFMSEFEARKDKWSFNTDVIYLDVSESTSRSVTVPELGPVTLGAKGDLKGWVVTPNLGYAVVDSNEARVELFGGVRYLDLALKADITADGEALVRGKVSGSNWDGIVGARATMFLNEKWYLPLYGDIGTGDSDLTWQLVAGIGYRFDKVNVTVAYRYLNYEFANGNDAILDNMKMKGPAMGLSIFF